LAGGARGVHPDTHLVLTFPAGPIPVGRIRILETEDGSVVDMLDPGIPSRPHVSLTQSAADARALELVLPADADLIRNYSNPAYVLDGQDPVFNRSLGAGGRTHPAPVTERPVIFLPC
jgi:hypothetical protein